MHKEAENAFQSYFDYLKKSKVQLQRVLDIGSKNHNGTIKHYFEGMEYTGLDKEPGHNVDVVADAIGWDAVLNGFGLYDLVICTEVLEHCPDPGGLFDTARKCLFPNGHFIVTAGGTGRPSHSSDGSQLKHGEYYCNISVDHLFELCEGRFEIVSIIYNFPPGDIYALLKAVKY